MSPSSFIIPVSLSYMYVYIYIYSNTSNSIFPYYYYDNNILVKFIVTINRTTISCESFHSSLNEMFHTSHPSIYNFIDKDTIVC